MIYAKRGLILRLLYLCVACLHLLFSRLFCVRKRGCVVLCYHGVKKNQRAKFARQMQMVVDRTISVENLFNVHKRDQLFVCVTFDDAFENILENVVPIVDRIGIPIMVFVPTGSLGRLPVWLENKSHSDSSEAIMARQQLKYLSENPLVTVGSHTVSHPRLSLLSDEKIQKELYESKIELEDLTNSVVDQLAFPHGDCTEEVVSMAIEIGYRHVYTLAPVIYNGEESLKREVVGRFSMSPDVWQIEFLLTVKGAYSWLFAWRSFLKKIR